MVFDASKATYSGTSLNDSLMKGPLLQDELASLSLRWEKYKIVFSANIEKRYRQVKMRLHHIEFQIIVWRDNPDDEIEDFQLMTVTFGTKSALFFATRVIQHLAMDEKDRFSIASRITLSDFYVDDLLSGTDSIETALEAQ